MWLLFLHYLLPSFCTDRSNSTKGTEKYNYRIFRCFCHCTSKLSFDIWESLGQNEGNGHLTFVLFFTFETYLPFTTKIAGNELIIQNFIKKFSFLALFAIVLLFNNILTKVTYVDLGASKKKTRFSLSVEKECYISIISMLIKSVHFIPSSVVMCLLVCTLKLFLICIVRTLTF